MKPCDLVQFKHFSYVNQYLVLEDQAQPPDAYFANIATAIAQDIKPHTVLDVGCDQGLLVEALHKSGIQAWGVDSSRKVVNQAVPEVLQYCFVAPLAKPFPQYYSLITCLESVAYFSLGMAKKIIKNICQHTNDVLFSSTPFFYKGIRPENVQSPAYWAGIFAQYKFFHDVDHKTFSITPWCLRFRKQNLSNAEVISNYEKRLWRLNMESRARRSSQVETHSQLALRDGMLEQIVTQNRAKQSENDALKEEITGLYSEFNTLRTENESLRADYASQQEEMDALRAEKEALSANIVALQAENETLRADTAALQADMGTMGAEKETLSANIAALQADMGAMRAENETLRASLVALQAENETLRADIVALQADMGAMRAENENLRRERNTYFNEITDIYNSRSWKVIKIFQRIRTWIIPPKGTR